MVLSRQAGEAMLRTPKKKHGRLRKTEPPKSSVAAIHFFSYGVTVIVVGTDGLVQLAILTVYV